MSLSYNDVIDAIRAALPETEPLTKRELFAAMAIQGLLAGDAFSEAVRESGEEFAQPIAEMARLCADALLAELAKEPTR